MLNEDDFEWVIRNDPQIESQEKYDSLVEPSLGEVSTPIYEESETLYSFNVSCEFTIINKD